MADELPEYVSYAAGLEAQHERDLREIRDLKAEIAGLRAELDQRGDYRVELCMDRDLDTVMRHATDARERDRIRCTDTGREFVLRDGAWFEERPYHLPE